MDEKLRILLCEDDENLGMLLREYLQAKGYSAELYPDGFDVKLNGISIATHYQPCSYAVIPTCQEKQTEITTF